MKLTEKQVRDLEQIWFENFLKDEHYDRHQSTLDDDLSDSYDNWISNLSESEIYDLSEKWSKMQSRWIAEEFIERNFGK